MVKARPETPVAMNVSPKTKVSLTIAATIIGAGSLLGIAWGARGSWDDLKGEIKQLIVSVDGLTLAMKDLGTRVSALERR